MEDNHIEQLSKWRLMLGEYSKEKINDISVDYMDMEEALDFLYSREYTEENGIRKGGQNSSNLTVATWITKVRELFPKKTVEIIERHALENFNMNELLTDKEVLEKLEPNQELLKTIIQLKGMMKGEVLETAERIVRKVVDEIMEKFETNVKETLVGRIDKNSSGLIRCSRNLDMKKTIRKNLKNYNLENKEFIVSNVYFNSRIKIYNTWKIIIAVDESGSMLGSVIYSSIMAGIFAKLPMLDTKLIIFDTQVVDLSGYIDDPVRTLMSVQLGGGTDIQKALRYCESLIENPYKTIVILVSDLYEGYGYNNLYSVSKDIIESGSKMIVLTALDMEANPNYDRQAGIRLAEMGAEVSAMTPENLAEWIGKII